MTTAKRLSKKKCVLFVSHWVKLFVSTFFRSLTANYFMGPPFKNKALKGSNKLLFMFTSLLVLISIFFYVFSAEEK